MKSENGNLADFDGVAKVGLVFVVAGFILISLLILMPVIILSFIMAEVFLTLSFKENGYSIKKKEFLMLGYAMLIYGLFISIPSVYILEKFRGLLFIFFDNSISILISKFINFIDSIIPGKPIFKNITGIALRYYLWTVWPLALLFSMVKIKKDIKPLMRIKLTKRNKFENYINLGKFKNKLFNNEFNITYEQLRHHVHILGASGFGKSVFLNHLITDLIKKSRGLLFVDLKADIDTIKQVVELAFESGRIEKLKFFSCANPEFSSYYNILGRGNANQLRDRIISAFTWSEEFYKNESMSVLLKLLIPIVWIRDNTTEAPHLSTLLKSLKDPDYISELKLKINPDRVDILAHLEEVDKYLRDRETFRNIQGLRTQLEGILLTDFGYRLCPNDDSNKIDIFEAVKNTEIIYFLLDSRRYSESAKSLGRMVLQDLKATSAEIDGTLAADKRRAFNIIIDEFSDMASDDFISFLDRARSSGMGTVLAHQEISDLKTISPETANRLMQLTSTTIAFLTKLPDSSEAISSMAGTRTAYKTTERAQNILGVEFRSGDISLRQVEEFLIHPNSLKKLTVGEAVIIGKYPNSYSGIVKINPPIRSQMSEIEFQRILETFKDRKQYMAPLVIRKPRIQDEKNW